MVWVPLLTEEQLIGPSALLVACLVVVPLLWAMWLKERKARETDVARVLVDMKVTDDVLDRARDALWEQKLINERATVAATFDQREITRVQRELERCLDEARRGAPRGDAAPPPRRRQGGAT